MDEGFPAPRRYTVDLDVAGEERIRFGDTHPKLCGWVLSWVTAHGIAAALPMGIITCSDRWYEQAVLEFGDTTTAPSFSQGGRVYVPYPTVTLDLFDAGGVGDVNINIIGRPVMSGETVGAKTTLVGYVHTVANAGGTGVVAIPNGAQRYWCVQAGIPNAAAISSSLTVQVQGGAAFGSQWDIYTLDDNPTANQVVTPAPWRQLPPVDFSSNGRVRIDNNDAVVNTRVATYFEFDFSAGR